MSSVSLRPYQQEARAAIHDAWESGQRHTLLVLPTGTGKTIVFAVIAEDCVRRAQRVLILAHRSELLEQAADKIFRATGLRCAVEKAEETSLGSWYAITVGSVQSLQRPKRLSQFAPDYFGTIIIDEAHHAVSESYRRILEHFPAARVLGVTATPDRGDMKNLGQVFDGLAYEYNLMQAVRDGYLCPILAQTIPLKLDLGGVAVRAGDFAADDIDTAIEPYLEQIADEMEKACRGRRTVVFLPLIKTAQKFRDILNAHSLRAAEVNGQSEARAETLADFAAGKYDVLCNAMLLTEGWDCPPVDCIAVLRPTKSRALYSQMVGRGTRLSPGKYNLLLLDFLWLTERHELCRPADLVCQSREVAQQMTENLAASGCPEELDAAEEQASADVVAQREASLAKQLKEMRTRQKRLVDPLQYEMSIGAEDLAGYAPSFGWEMAPASDKQLAALERYGINAASVDCAGKASLLLDRLHKRSAAGLATPKQIRLLEQKGFLHVGNWPFEAASSMISRMSVNRWQPPPGVNPATYIPV